MPSAYGPLSYHTPGRIFPRDALREPFDPAKRRRRPLLANLLSDSTPLDFEQSLVAAALARTALTAYISTAFYPDDIPEQHPKSDACVVYAIESDDALQTLTSSTDTRNVTVTLACCSLRYQTTKRIADAIEAWLGDAVGRLGGALGVLVTNAICDEHKENYELRLDGRDRPLRVREVTFHFSYR